MSLYDRPISSWGKSRTTQLPFGKKRCPEVCWVLGMVPRGEQGCSDALLAPSLRGQPHPSLVQRLKRDQKAEEKSIIPCHLSLCLCLKEEGRALSRHVGKCWPRRFCCLLHSGLYPLPLPGREQSCQSYRAELEILSLTALVGAVMELTLPLPGSAPSRVAPRWVVGEGRRLPRFPEECCVTDTVNSCQHMSTKSRGLLVGVVITLQFSPENASLIGWITNMDHSQPRGFIYLWGGALQASLTYSKPYPNAAHLAQPPSLLSR